MDLDKGGGGFFKNALKMRVFPICDPSIFFSKNQALLYLMVLQLHAIFEKKLLRSLLSYLTTEKLKRAITMDPVW